MQDKRLTELLELLLPAWKHQPDLNLLQFLQQLAEETGFTGNLSSLPDDVLIYHLKMCGSDKQSTIPGLQKDYEDDFKTAILKARGVIKD